MGWKVSEGVGGEKRAEGTEEIPEAVEDGRKAKGRCRGKQQLAKGATFREMILFTYRVSIYRDRGTPSQRD